MEISPSSGYAELTTGPHLTQVRVGCRNTRSHIRLRDIVCNGGST